MNDSEDNHLKQELYNLIREDSKIFDFIQGGSLDGLWYWDLEHPENEWMSPAFWELLGYDPAEKKHLTSEWQDLINQDDLKVAMDNFSKHCENPDHPYDQVIRYRHKDGSTVWVRCRGIAIRDADGKPVRMLGAHNDLTALMITEEMLVQRNKELNRIARHDYLTSLYNRRAFDELFFSLLSVSRRQHLPISVTLIDIDHFKRINDRFGHQRGDEVLKIVAYMLKEHARDSDIVARYGGEEFILLTVGANKAASLKLAERFRAAIQDNNWGEKQITVSAGISTYLSTDRDVSAADMTALSTRIIEEADKALYFSKRNGRNQIHHYER